MFTYAGECVSGGGDWEGILRKGRFTPPAPPKHKQAGPFPEGAFAYPVIANGMLYIRDLGTLWAYDIQASGWAPGPWSTAAVELERKAAQAAQNSNIIRYRSSLKEVKTGCIVQLAAWLSRRA
jgi:hypothetical protein